MKKPPFFIRRGGRMKIRYRLVTNTAVNGAASPARNLSSAIWRHHTLLPHLWWEHA